MQVCLQNTPALDRGARHLSCIRLSWRDPVSMGRKVDRARQIRRPITQEVRLTSSNHRLGRRVGPAFLTVSQLCRRWQLGRRTVYKFIGAKVLPAWRVGSHLYRIAVEDVLRFEAQKKVAPK